MIVDSLLNNPFGKKSGPWKPWYGYLLGIVVVASVGLYVFEKVRGGPVAPTSTVPAIGYQDIVEPDEGPTVNEDVPTTSTEEELPAAAPEGISDTLPVEKNLAVPFTSQAPFANWDVVHEDTCEEASILMVDEYYEGKTTALDPAYADTHLLAMVDMEGKNGYGTSLTAAQLGSFAELYFGDVTAKVIEDPTIEEIKTYVNKGIPVIVPAAGQHLGNPFFSGEGPLYHYYVIRGFDGTNFITNDPGTRHGENYTYSAEVVMRTMGDWNNGDPVNGEKRILILEPVK
jgi:hypothetical protein